MSDAWIGKDYAKVLVDEVSVRAAASDTADEIGKVFKDDMLVVYQRSEDGKWIMHGTNAWSKIQDSTGDLIQILHPDSQGNYVPVNKENEEKDQKEAEENQQTFTSGLGFDYFDPTAPDSEKKRQEEKERTTDYYNQMMVHSCRGIYGMPYQYMEEVDMRVDSDINSINSDSFSAFGYEYSTRILANMPVLLLTPGAPKFMKGYKAADKDSLLKALKEKNTDVMNEIMESKDGRLYSFEFRYSDYYKIVNPICHQMAIYMQVEDELLDGVPLKNYDWMNYAVNTQGFLGTKESIAFYIDSENQISETFSNDTSASSLAQTVNGLSDTARELQFLLGAGAGKEFDMLKQDNYNDSIKKLDQWTSKFSTLASGGIIDKLKEGFMTIATGGKMLFPEIWNDSQFSKSYDVTIKLRCPNPDPLSLYFDILVPIAHILGLCGAQQLGANGYKSPFLIRGYYKGFFNIDMGIITSANINKGDKGKWTVNGVPTAVDIQLNIKDLYSMLFLSNDDSLFNTLKNTAQVDYIANLCGINVNKVDIARAIDLKLSSVRDMITNRVTANHFADISQYANNFLSGIYEGIK